MRACVAGVVASGAFAACCGPALAHIPTPFEFRGMVMDSTITQGPLAGAMMGEPVLMEFTLQHPGFVMEQGRREAFFMFTSTFLLTVGELSVGADGTESQFIEMENDVDMVGMPGMMSDGVVITPRPLAYAGYTLQFEARDMMGMAFMGTDTHRNMGMYDTTMLPMSTWTIQGPGGQSMNIAFMDLMIMPSPGALALPAGLAIIGTRRRR
jgi:hypothetical protein